MLFSSDSKVWDILCNPVGREVMVKITRELKQEHWLKMSWAMNLPLKDFLNRLDTNNAKFNLEIILKCLNDSVEYIKPSVSELTKAWWKERVFYELLPNDFMLHNFSVTHDFSGVIQRIPYFLKLGIQAFLLCCDRGVIEPDYFFSIYSANKSHLGAFQRLLDACHNSNLRVIMEADIVSTSFEHEWFIKALEDPDGFYGQFYFFEKGSSDRPPNKWKNYDDTGSWKWIEDIDRWVLCLADSNRADLNWGNPEVRKEIFKVLKMWIEKGVDGFRFIHLSYLHKGYLEKGKLIAPENQKTYGYEFYQYHTKMHDYLKEIRCSVKENDIFLSSYMDFEFSDVSVLYTWPPKQELDLIFNILRGESDSKFKIGFDLRILRDSYLRRSDYSDKRNWSVLSYSDAHLVWLLNGAKSPPIYRDILSKLLATLIFTLRGTPVVYQGFELGLYDLTNRLSEEALQKYEEKTMTFIGKESSIQLLKTSLISTKDPNDLTEYDAHMSPNLQMQNANSTWSYYKKLIELRKENEALVYGTFMPVLEKNPNIFCYFKVYEGTKFYIEINITTRSIIRPGKVLKNYKLITSNYGRLMPILRPYEANIYLVE